MKTVLLLAATYVLAATVVVLTGHATDPATAVVATGVIGAPTSMFVLAASELL